MTDHNDLERKRKKMTLWLIWISFLASLGIYVVVAHLLASTGSLPAEMPGESLVTIRYILMGLSIVILLAIPVTKKVLLRSGQTPSVEGPPKVEPDLAKYTIALVIAWAMSESVGIFGLVLFMLGADFTTLYIFIVASAVSLIFHRPQIPEYEML